MEERVALYSKQESMLRSLIHAPAEHALSVVRPQGNLLFVTEMSGPQC